MPNPFFDSEDLDFLHPLHPFSPRCNYLSTNSETGQVHPSLWTLVSAICSAEIMYEPCISSCEGLLLSISVSGHWPCPEDFSLLNILCNHSSICLLVHTIFHSAIAVWSHSVLLFMCTCIVCPLPLEYKYHKGRDLVFLGHCYDPREQTIPCHLLGAQ